MKLNKKYRLAYRNFALIVLIMVSSLSLDAQNCWENFRGDAKLTGRTGASLPMDPELLWNFKTGDAIKASPVVCDGIIIVGSVDGNLYGISLTGELKWKIQTGNGIEAPALIHDGIAYVGNLDGKVLAVEAQTGRTLWNYSTDGQIMGSPNLWLPENSSGMDGRKKAVLVVGSYDYYLHGIDAGTGAGLWKYEADNFINGAPAIDGNLAIFGGCDGLLHQVDIMTGEAKSREPVATYVAGSVAVEYGVTFVGDYDGRFTCLNLDNGKEKWSFSNEQTQLPFIAAPSLSDKYVFIGNRDKYVYAFNKEDGELAWKVNTRGRVDASPVLAKNGLLIATMRGDVLIMDPSEGKIEWSYELGAPITGTPAVLNNTIIVGADDGRIYLFGMK